MKYLITGGCGFLGTNLADEVLRRGEELFIFDNLSRTGSADNLRWLKGLGQFQFIHGDIRNQNDVDTAVRTAQPDVVFHLAGQVAMTTSLANPRLDFEINALGTHSLLEGIRKLAPEAIVIYSSTNKVYGDLEEIKYQENSTRYVATDYPQGFDEKTRLDFRSPYGCSKGAADQYILDYHRNYQLRTVVFRHSSIFGNRQFSTFDQGWVGWFIQKALEIQSETADSPFTISGNGKQVRDILFSEDLIKCYFQAVEKIQATQGHTFNIGGGPENSFSLLELFGFLEKELQIKMNYTQLPPRSSDQKVFVADTTKAKSFFNWHPKLNKEDGVRKMIHWIKER